MNKVLESWELEYRSPESMLEDMVSPCVLQDGIENKMILEVSIQPATYTMWKPRPTNKYYFKQRRVSKDWEQRLSSDPKKHMVSWSCTYAYIHTDECTHIHTPTPPHTHKCTYTEKENMEQIPWWKLLVIAWNEKSPYKLFPSSSMS